MSSDVNEAEIEREVFYGSFSTIENALSFLFDSAVPARIINIKENHKISIVLQQFAGQSLSLSSYNVSSVI
jgi:hypothetical protein